MPLLTLRRFREPRLSKEEVATFGPRGMAEVRRWFDLNGGTQTPLVEIPELAASCGVAQVHVKDEGCRLGQSSFKALGGGFAVASMAVATASLRLGRPSSFEELASPNVRRITARLTFACATAGNHGRAVASAATALGARAVIFVPEAVSPRRLSAIQAVGGEVIVVRGTYEDAVAEADRRATAEGWVVVSDKSRPADARTTRLVMQGYGLIAEEFVAALRSPPTHVFVQAGVGGLAASIACHLTIRFGVERPAVVVVEPDDAACLLRSAAQRKHTHIVRGPHTSMAMLACYEPSLIAWRLLMRTADGFMSVPDGNAEIAASFLRGRLGQIGTTPSGACGLAGLQVASANPDYRDQLNLRPTSRVLLINTESAEGDEMPAAFEVDSHLGRVAEHR